MASSSTSASQSSAEARTQTNPDAKGPDGPSQPGPAAEPRSTSQPGPTPGKSTSKTADTEGGTGFGYGEPGPEDRTDALYQSADDVADDEGGTGFGYGVPADAVEAPTQSASKSEWVDYAVTQGETREDAEEATKAELIEEHGK